jgi:hypothetical protein
VCAADREPGERLPKTCYAGIAGGLPCVLEHLVGVEWPANVEQLLRLLQRLLERAGERPQTAVERRPPRIGSGRPSASRDRA